jgi:acyl carrier protein
MPVLEQEIRTIIIENFHFGEDDGKLSNDDSFLDQGIIDSTGILELVALLEGKYGIKIKNDELEPANLDSINKLVRFINRKTQLSTAEGNARTKMEA